MTIDRKPTRYAHSDGHTDVCYSEDGSKLISCGTDGDIRIWSGFDDDDPVQTCVGEWSLCVRQKGQHLQVATDNSNVQLVTFPEGERDGILMRFVAPINHMSVGAKHDWIALASEDMEVKVMSLNVENNVTKTFTGLKATPLSCALCPKGKMLAVSSGDGYLRVWDVETEDLLKEFDGVPKANSFTNAKSLCRMDFDPIHGRLLAYPDKNKVIIVNTLDWDIKHTFSCEAVESDLSIVQFSPCGKFVAAASLLGDLLVWEVASETLVDGTVHPKSVAICAMVWNPKGNGEIAYCDVQGQLGIALNCNQNEDIDEPEGAIEEQLDGEIDLGDVGIIDDDDEDNENAVSLEKLKKEIMGDGSEKDPEERSIMSAPTPRPRTPEIPLQNSFMPSSTPEHLNPRYLCWNGIAVIRCYGNAEETESGRSIEVEFHDSTFHNSMMIQNFQNYFMGTVSMSALAVANSSQINVIPLSSNVKEWNLTVNEDEEITCIACSSNLVCYATNNYFIRVCTVFGTQKAIFSVPGPVVSMSAFGYFLLIAYHSGAVRKSDQCIGMMLVKLEGLSVESREIQVALSPECNLQWLGFTDLGNPALMDSYGMLFVYPLKCNAWIPFCDTTRKRASPADGFFITTIYESLQTVRGIRCRGSMYPGFTPRPIETEIELLPPFTEISTEKSQLEANLFMWSNLQIENTEKKFKETALKTFALACKNHLDQRAFELIELLGNTQVLNLALKYASKMERRRLVEKLTDLASKIETLDENEDPPEETNKESTPVHMIRPLNRKLVLSSKSKYKSTPNGTPSSSNDSVINESSLTPLGTKLNASNLSVTQDTTFSEEEPKNPFLKSMKKAKANTYNPLSLTDKFAGYTVEKENKNKETNDKKKGDLPEKRKQPDSEEPDKQKEKQRKLDFMFAKRS